MLQFSAFGWSKTLSTEDSLVHYLIWNKIRYLAPIWYKAHGLFNGVSLTKMLWDLVHSYDSFS